MKNPFRWLLALSLSMGLAGSVVWAIPQSPIAKVDAIVSQPLPTNKSLSFLQTANSAQLVAVNSTAGIYSLVLKKPSPYITYFSDRPYRNAGFLALDEFMHNWKKGKNSFSHNPPNAVLFTKRSSWFDIRGTTITVPVELQQMQYNRQQHTVCYTVRFLTTKPPQVQTKQEKLAYTALFIDDWRLSCIG